MPMVMGFDRRSLGLFRIVLGVYMIYHTIVFRFGNFAEVYAVSTGFRPADFTPQGLFRDLLATDVEVFILLGINLLASLALMTGFKTRWAAFLLYAIFSFFNLQYNFITFGWDRYLEAVLLVAVLLPLSDRFSMFKRRSNTSEQGQRYDGLFKWIALLQIALIYGVAGLGKNGELWQNGMASAILLSDGLLTFPTADFLLRFPWATKALTYSTVLFELSIPMLLFSPWKRGACRIAAAVLLITFHWGIAVFMDVGHFKFGGLLFALLLLPTEFWERFTGLEHRLNQWFRERFADPYPFRALPARLARPLGTGLFVLLLYGMVASNFYHITSHPDRIGQWAHANGADRLARKVYRDFGVARLHFHQNWYLYAPNPTVNLGKLYIVGILPDGSAIDLETGKPYVAGVMQMRSERRFADLRKFYHTKLRNYANKRTAVNRIIDYAQYRIHRWNENGGPALDRVVVYNYRLNAYKFLKGESEGYQEEIAIEFDLGNSGR